MALEPSHNSLRELSPSEVQAELARGAIVVDIRKAPEFGAAHLPGAISVQLSKKNFAERVATVIAADTSIVLVAANGALSLAAYEALLEADYAKVLGCLAGGLEAWKEAGLPTSSLRQISVQELFDRLNSREPELAILDVREPSEWDELGWIDGAALVPLGELETRLAELPSYREMAILCEVGIRSSTAASILARHGFASLANVAEGMGAWTKAGYPVITRAAESG
ncbi:MAG: hypothetical protein HY675_08465 [Chloroflexi bacterium]|nr:hypothetical protein [Chloroflexota bacterium]